MKLYRYLTGPDDAAFCQRVSEALAQGYVLWGGPAIAVGAAGPVVAQAVVLPTVLKAGGETR